MMIIIFTLLILAIYIILQIDTYGNFISKKDSEYIIFSVDEHDLILNRFNTDILLINKSCGFIAPVFFNLLAKYYVEGEGLVFRWSKLHRQINKWYKIAKINNLKNT